MKNKILLIILLVGLFFPITSVFAHVATKLDPYGIPQSENYHDYLAHSAQCDEMFSGSSYTESQNSKLRSICKNKLDIYLRASEMRDRTKRILICNDLKVEIRAWDEVMPLEYKGDNVEGDIQNEVQNCYKPNPRASFLDPSTSIRIFDEALFFITSGLSLIFLFTILWLKGIRGWKFFIMPVFFQVMISTIIGFVASFPHEFELGKGPIIAPLHDILFFQRTNIPSIMFGGMVIALLSFLLIRLFLRYFKNDLEWRQRRMIAIFYTLVFNPFFFPIGILVALMNVIYTRKSSQ